MAMALVSTEGRAGARVVRVTEPPVQPVLLLVHCPQRAVPLHRHVDLLQHAVAFDEEIPLSQRRDPLPFLGIADDLRLERVQSADSGDHAVLLRLEGSEIISFLVEIRDRVE